MRDAGLQAAEQREESRPGNDVTDRETEPSCASQHILHSIQEAMGQSFSVVFKLNHMDRPKLEIYTTPF